MGKDKYSETFEDDLEMLRYFQEEFMFRQSHYWNILFKFFVLTIVVAILPIAGEVFGISLNSIQQKYLIFFPILACLIASFSLIILLDEARKVQAVNEAKYRINRMNMDSRYHYEYYNDQVGKGMNKSKKRRWLAFKMPWFTFALEIIIIVCSWFVAFG